MVSRFWSHGRQLAVFARTGATPVHAGAEAKTQVLYLCYGFEQQQRSERTSRSRNRTAVCEYLRSIECQLCE